MADPSLGEVLMKLAELAVAQTNQLIAVRNDIELLQDKLGWLRLFVRDADRRRRAGIDHDGPTFLAVTQTRQVAFVAEDALYDFFKDDQGENVNWRRPLEALGRGFSCLYTNTVLRYGFIGRIDIIKRRLEEIKVNQENYNVEHTPSTVLASSDSTGIAAWQDDLEKAVGFEKDVEIIKQMLVRTDEQNPKQARFICIVGESGTGKYTLAKVICGEMRSELQVVVRCNMVPGSSPLEFLIEVHRLAYRQCYNGEELGDEEISEHISEKLRHLLAGKRYLLVLSGISSTASLNIVMTGLPGPRNPGDHGGHVILILDPGNELARHGDTKKIDGFTGVHELALLDEARSGQLFFWKVLSKEEYENENWSTNPNDIECSRLVHAITGGHPLAIVLLAGLLRFKEKPGHWDAVLQKLNGDTRSALKRVFWATFEDLPDKLKPCFLYLAAYPNDVFQSADVIVRMWIGENFIKPQGSKPLEDLGHECLEKLVSRSLVEVEELKAAGGGIQLVRVHKSIISFLRSEVSETGFMEIRDINDISDRECVRRLSVQSGNGRRHSSTFANKKFTKLRSFICHIISNDPHEHDIKFLCGSKSIRVISVQGLRLAKLPRKIGNLINLRYLRVDCIFLRDLPPSIARLLNLETLDIRNTRVEEIDMDFWRIKTLRHVLATDLTLPETMPEDGGGSELQTLHGVKPAASGEWTAGNCPLDKMARLQSMQMHGIIKARHCRPAFDAALGNMPHLGHLNLEGDGIPSCVLTDPSLQSLQTMALSGDWPTEDGIVDWRNIEKTLTDKRDNITIRQVRPNLVKLKLNYSATIWLSNKMRAQLEGILLIH